MWKNIYKYVKIPINKKQIIIKGAFSLNGLEKKYGFWTAVAMVVGIVIGSGVFFKAEKVLRSTGGSMLTGILAWIAGGSIMIICAYAFSILARRYSKVNGIVDYSEASLGSTYGYIVGWFMSTIYYPSLAAVLCWITAKYTVVLFGIGDHGTNITVYLIGIGYLFIIYILNLVAPILAGKLQVSVTFIKLIPLLLMGVVGVFKGVASGQTIQNFVDVSTDIVVSNPFLTAIVATAFAYEGWIIATTINSELKNSKKDLPRALILGSIFIVIIYLLYFIGISGSMPISEFISGGDDSIRTAFFNVLGSFGGSTLFIFIIMSCLGSLNGVTIASVRGLYSLAVRGMGPMNKTLSKVSKRGTPLNSGIVGLCIILLWLILWYGSNKGWWGTFLDFSELPVISMYALYIPIFLWMMRAMKELNFFQRYIIPVAAIFSSLFMIYATLLSHGVKSVLIYCVLFAVIILIGLAFKNPNKKESL